jgi:hypothetical protein
MKRSITIAGLCAILFACQASTASNDSESVPLDDSSLTSTVDPVLASDDASLLTPISTLFSPDGPDGPLPYTCLQDSMQP